jgi:hypothetical protein
MAWNAEKVRVFRESFYDFLSHVRIASKETERDEPIVLYEAQRRFLDGIFDGLADDIHSFTCLKARQLGISTASYLLTLFYVSVFPGLKGAIVFDKDGTREEFRNLIKAAMKSLPPSHAISTESENRHGAVFPNGSTLSYLVAGVRKSKGSGGLGRGLGLNFLHATEASSWGDEDGLASLQRSLADKHPNRLYIWESTARGMNMFRDMWLDAIEDDLAQRAIFIGWWAKDTYRIEKETPLFQRYGLDPPSKEEVARIVHVKEEYGYDVTVEQLAWYRHAFDPRRDKDEEEDSFDVSITTQELPWTAEEAFILSGSQFFPGTLLNAAANEAHKPEHKFKGYRYFLGENFQSSFIEQVTRYKDAELKIWEDPDPNGVYIVAGDPAYGASDTADRYAAQVFRCYSDGLEQVAEYVVRDMRTYQFAWVLAGLCGLYGQYRARIITEINGPGEAVWNAFRELEKDYNSGNIKPKDGSTGARNILENVRQYFYRRRDSMGGGYFYQWVTSGDRKIQIMQAMRDIFCLGQLRVYSLQCIEEMKTIRQDGPIIQAELSKKDDRVLACAMAVRAWQDFERKTLQTQGLTRELAVKSKNFSHEDMSAMFFTNLKDNALADIAFQRRMAMRKARPRGSSRWGW